MPKPFKIIDSSGDKKYFAIIPYYIVNHSSHWEQSLYLVMKRMSGESETGTCYATQETLAMKMQTSHPTVSRTLRKLVKRGWIELMGTRPGKTHPVSEYRIVDLWKTNMDFYNNEEIAKPQNKSLGGDSETTEQKIAKPQNTEEETIRRRNNNDNTIVLSGDKPLTYGNGDINSLIDYLKEKLGLPALDGSQKQNRRYCWLCLNKFGGPEKIRLLIDATNQSDFWKTKITSFSQLYYKAVRIISETRKGGYAVDATQLR